VGSVIVNFGNSRRPQSTASWTRATEHPKHGAQINLIYTCGTHSIWPSYQDNVQDVYFNPLAKARVKLHRSSTSSGPLRSFHRIPWTEPGHQQTYYLLTVPSMDPFLRYGSWAPT